jgi:uncharacterized damage-inducible protein DinB
MPALVRPVVDDRDALLAFLDQQRQAVRLATYGLGEDEARVVPGPGPLGLGGLVKHLTAVERSWTGTLLERPPVRRGDRRQLFRMEPDETLAGLLEEYRQACAATDAAVAADPDLDRPVPAPTVSWLPDGVEAWSVRWVLLHLITETARHAGHADRVREALDGATAMPLMAAAEAWPASAGVRPWPPEPGEG